MVCGNEHALGRTQQFFVANEAICGSIQKPVSTDAAKILSASLAVEQERKSRDDKRLTRSLLERITGKASAPWSCESYLLPSGTAGTPPDMHQLLYAVFGAYTNTPATSDVYTLSTMATGPRSNTIYAATGSGGATPIVMEAIVGAFADIWGLSVSGGDEPKMTFEGWGTQHVHTGNSLVVSIASADVTVTAGEGENFELGSLVQVGSDDNGGAGYLVIGVVGDVVTLEAAPTASPTDPIVPFVPAETTAGNPVNGVTGDITIGGFNLPITAFDVSVNNALKPTDDEAFEQYPTDAIVQRRTVTGNISLRARKDAIILLGQRKAFNTHAIVVTMGSGAGTTVTVNIPYAEYDFAALEVPEADEAVISLPFTALGSSGEDEITLSFT